MENEVKPGEKVSIGFGPLYHVRQNNSPARCNKCAFKRAITCLKPKKLGPCSPDERSDGKGVYFHKLGKQLLNAGCQVIDLSKS